MPIDLDIRLALDNCAAPSTPRSRTGSRCDHDSFHTPLSHISHHTTGLLAYQEVDDALGLTTISADTLADARPGKKAGISC